MGQTHQHDAIHQSSAANNREHERERHGQVDKEPAVNGVFGHPLAHGKTDHDERGDDQWTTVKNIVAEARENSRGRTQHRQVVDCSQRGQEREEQERRHRERDQKPAHLVHSITPVPKHDRRGQQEPRGQPAPRRGRRELCFKSSGEQRYRGRKHDQRGEQIFRAATFGEVGQHQHG